MLRVSRSTPSTRSAGPTSSSPTPTCRPGSSTQPVTVEQQQAFDATRGTAYVPLTGRVRCGSAARCGGRLPPTGCTSPATTRAGGSLRHRELVPAAGRGRGPAGRPARRHGTRDRQGRLLRRRGPRGGHGPLTHQLSRPIPDLTFAPLPKWHEGEGRAWGEKAGSGRDSGAAAALSARRPRSRGCCGVSSWTCTPPAAVAGQLSLVMTVKPVWTLGVTAARPGLRQPRRRRMADGRPAAGRRAPGRCPPREP